MVQDVRDCAAAELVDRQAEELEEQHVLGGHRYVRLELAGPPPLLVLRVEEPVYRASERYVGFRLQLF